MPLDKLKDFLSRARATLPGRWLWLLIGLGLLANGQYLMHQRDPVGAINKSLDLWNVTLRLEIVNMQNFGAAVPYLLGGGLLSALAFHLGWNKGEETQAVNYAPGSVPLGGTFRAAVDWAYLLPRLGLALLLFATLIFKLARHEYTSILPWLWVLVLALLTHLLYRNEKTRGAAPSPNITRADIFWMAGLFTLSLGIGSTALNDIPNIMIPDEGSFWEAARAIGSGELKPPLFDFGVYTFPIASSIFQGWVMRITGLNLWGWRFASVLAGALTVIPLYLLAREWFDRRVAVIAALFMVSSPYYLSFARMGYNNSQALFPVALSVYFWSLGYKQYSSLYYWLAGLAAGLGFYTYPAAWLGLVTILAVMVIFLAIRRIQFRVALPFIAAFLAAVALTAGPRFVYGASSESAEPLFHKLVETSFVSSFYGSAYYGPAELYPQGLAYLFGKNQVFFAPEVYAELLTRGAVRTLAATFDPFIVTEHFMTTNFAGGYLPAIGLALGIALSLRTIKQARSILLLTWLVAGLFFLSMIAAFPPRHTHLVSVIPALALLSAVGFAASADTLFHGLGHGRGTWVRTGALVLASLVVFISGLREYFVVMPQRNPPLFEDIVSWIAWRTDEPLHIIYLDSTEKTPHRVEYHVNTGMVPHSYDSVSSYNFDWYEVPENSIVFMDPSEWSVVSTPPPGFDRSETYTNKDGETIGYAWSNAAVDLRPKAPVPIANGDFPVTIMPVVLVLVMLVLILIPVQIKIKTENMAGRPGLRVRVEITLRKTFRSHVED